MSTKIAFIIPVLHPENARDWGLQMSFLRQTADSIANQSCEDWRAVVVANTGANLPELPPKFEVEYVDFPPNPMMEQGENDLEVFRDAIRLDKGRRVLAGMLKAKGAQYFMVVDNDDFVSSELTAHVAKHQGENGWFVENGYVWTTGSALLYRYTGFSGTCGSSLIIRSDLYGLPETFEDASPSYIKKFLGSHIFITKHLETVGTPLLPLPFYAAIYRVGHACSHSVSDTVWRRYIFRPEVRRQPKELIKRILKIRFRGARIKREFWGA